MPSSNYRFYWPPVTRPVIAIGVVTSALWLATIFSTPLRDLAMVQLSVQGSTLPAMRPWAILTYPLWHFDFLQLLFHLLALYLFGSELTREIGARRWWATLTAGALAAGGPSCSRAPSPAGSLAPSSPGRWTWATRSLASAPPPWP
jgi:membrane associated rhomboid family serine protease